MTSPREAVEQAIFVAVGAASLTRDRAQAIVDIVIVVRDRVRNIDELSFQTRLPAVEKTPAKLSQLQRITA